jgi:hypothetical protein
MLFTATTCRICEKFLPQLDAFAEDHASEFEAVIICSSEPEVVRRWLSGQMQLARAIPDPGERLGVRYGIGIVPSCVSSDQPTGVLAAHGCCGHIRHLRCTRVGKDGSSCHPAMP